MFNNAKIYNIDESYIFKNACRLERVLADKCKILIRKKEKLIQNLNSHRPINHAVTKK
jgi:MFS superfamily sulfate permease-like transporter